MKRSPVVMALVLLAAVAAAPCAADRPADPGGPVAGFSLTSVRVQNLPLDWWAMKLRRMGVATLELGLDPYGLRDPRTEQLAREALAAGFMLSFHLPFKPPYNVAGFSGRRRAKVLALYGPSLAFAARFANRGRPTSLVVHGARGRGSRARLVRDTRAFLEYVTTLHPGFRPCLELLPTATRGHKIGDRKAELVEVVSSLDRAGICWDLGHDVKNGSPADPPGFLARVRHVHVHDVAPGGVDHHPLVFGRVDVQGVLGRLVAAGFKDSAVMELSFEKTSEAARRRGVSPLRITEESAAIVSRALGHPVDGPSAP